MYTELESDVRRGFLEIWEFLIRRWTLQEIAWTMALFVIAGGNPLGDPTTVYPLHVHRYHYAARFFPRKTFPLAEKHRQGPIGRLLEERSNVVYKLRYQDERPLARVNSKTPGASRGRTNIITSIPFLSFASCYPLPKNITGNKFAVLVSKRKAFQPLATYVENFFVVTFSYL